MARKSKEVEVAEEVTPLTDLHWKFINCLLAGKNITDAATESGVSRRTATYWMMDNTQVRYEYEKARIALRQQFYERVAGLHDKALKALDDALSEEADPHIRFAAARFLYGAHLQTYCEVRQPKTSQELADNELYKAKMSQYDDNRAYITRIENE